MVFVGRINAESRISIILPITRQKIEIELRSDIYGQVNPNHPIPKQNMDIKNHSSPGLSRFRSQASHRALTTRQQTVQDDN